MESGRKSKSQMQLNNESSIIPDNDNPVIQKIGVLVPKKAQFSDLQDSQADKNDQLFQNLPLRETIKMQRKQSEGKISDSKKSLDRQRQVTSANHLSIELRTSQIIDGQVQYNQLKSSLQQSTVIDKTKIKELKFSQILYNSQNILQKDIPEDQYNLIHSISNPAANSILQYMRDVKQLKQQADKSSYTISQLASTMLDAFVYPKAQKVFNKTISMLKFYSNTGQGSILICDVQDSKNLQNNFNVFQIELNHHFNETPSPYIVQQRTTGRYIVYDNQGKLLIFSLSQEKISNENLLEQSKPLIEISLKQDYMPRKNPILHILEYLNFSILFVIGGYVNDKQNEGEILPVSQIQVFKLEKRMVSNSPLFTIELKFPRIQPIVFQYKIKNTKQKLLMILGGNSPNQFQNMYNSQDDKMINLVNANITCEGIDIKEVFDQVLRKNEEGKVSNIQVHNTMKINLNGKPITKSRASECQIFNKGSVCKNKGTTDVFLNKRIFLFAEKKQSVFEIKDVMMSEREISISNGEFEIDRDVTVLRTMVQIINNQLFLFGESDKIIKINLSNQEMKKFGSNRSQFKRKQDTSCACNIF